MTKAGIEALARNLAIELGDAGITVNAVTPGSIVNERNLADDPAYAERWAALNPAGRVGSGRRPGRDPLPDRAGRRLHHRSDDRRRRRLDDRGADPDDVVRLSGAIEAATDQEKGRSTS